MRRIKPLLPSLREKKRYVVFEVRSEKPIKSFNRVASELYNNMRQLWGDFGLAGAGLVFLAKEWNPKTQRGIAKVSHLWANAFKASFVFIQKIEDQPVIVNSVTTSGLLGKAKRHLEKL